MSLDNRETRLISRHVRPSRHGKARKAEAISRGVAGRGTGTARERTGWHGEGCTARLQASVYIFKEARYNVNRGGAP